MGHGPLSPGLTVSLGAVVARESPISASVAT